MNIDVEKIKKHAKSNQSGTPEFKKYMDSLYDLYNSFIVPDTEKFFDAEILKDELIKNSLKDQEINEISACIECKNTDVFLLFDYRLFQFIILYEISFLIPADQIFHLTFYENGKIDFYNFVRNLYVKESNESSLPKYIQEVNKYLLNFIIMYIKKIFLTTIPDDSILIPNNSGNITNILLLDNINPDNRALIAKQFIKLNSFAERIENSNPPIVLNNSEQQSSFVESDFQRELLFFNGRFHTIIIHSRKNIIRYIPLQFQMQLIWFYLSHHINPLLEYYSDSVLNDDSFPAVDEFNNNIDHIINKVEILNLFNQKFKLSIESDCKIYYKIENRWNIEDMIKSSNNYIIFFKDYLDRLYTKKTSRIEQRQNKILMFITIFQFTALLSVWNDYLSLLDIDIKKSAVKILPLFRNYTILETINLYLPVVFLIIIISMIIYIYRSRI